MLRVALETQFAQGRSTGLGVYATRLAEALRARGDVDVVELRDPSFDVWRFDRRLYWDQLRVRRLARAARADIVHFTGGTLPWRPPHPCVLTLHDLTWLRGVNRGRAYVRWYFGAEQPRLARVADAIVVNTAVSKRDVAEGLRVDESRISVAGAAVDERFFEVTRSPSSLPFVLAVGTIEQRKDLATAVRAIARISDLRLIAVGPATPYAEEVRRTAASLGVEERVDLRGFVDDATLLRLHGSAAAMIFPSRYEGFGFPPLQALAAGLPVVASRIPVLEEVLGECAWYAPPGDDETFAALLGRVLSGGPAVEQRVLQGRVHARSFTWQKVADNLVGVYRSVVSSKPHV